MTVKPLELVNKRLEYLEWVYFMSVTSVPLHWLFDGQYSMKHTEEKIHTEIPGKFHNE